MEGEFAGHDLGHAGGQGEDEVAVGHHRGGGEEVGQAEGDSAFQASLLEHLVYHTGAAAGDGDEGVG